MATITIENKTGRVIIPVYKFSGVDGKDVVLGLHHVIKDRKGKEQRIVGVPPGEHAIDKKIAELVGRHPTNDLFFSADMLSFHQRSPKKLEEEEQHVPVTMLCDTRALEQQPSKK